MYNIKKVFIVFLFLICYFSKTYGQNKIIDNGKPVSRIIILNENKQTQTAANILQFFLKKISNAKIEICTEGYGEGDILIGGKCPKSVKYDGFFLRSNKNIEIGGLGNGCIYGVISLLEKYLNVNYWGENEYDFKKQSTIVIPKINLISNPAFKYRQSQCYAIKNDSLYKWWMRFEEPNEIFAGGYWVHTAHKFLPSKKYGKSHPEYYAYYKGKRHPGDASQLCWTNPDVFKLISYKVDSIFKANPEQKLISISQNDGNYTNCVCDKCKEIDSAQGALSGSLIFFINKIAKQFPNKQFSTLAYLYSMKAPKSIKPLPNVNIMLCDIDCNRELPLSETISGREFKEALENWSKISKNIFVWDYGINFDNMVAPFPNFHILQPNIQLFKKNNVNMHFSQIGGSKGGDFSELRAYLISKLMWNPNIDVDSTMRHFLNGYYGSAGKEIYSYIKIMEGALICSGKKLWIYDSPVSHKDGMLKPELMKIYNNLFDKAEKKVEKQSVFLKRVQRSRLSLQYAELEIARTNRNKNINEILNKLNLFEKRIKEFNIKTLNERANNPIEYCNLYKNRYLYNNKDNLAYGAKVIYKIPPTGKYYELGIKSLTDGVFGGASFADSWIGWEGKDGEFIIDLGENKTIKSIETDFLHQIGAWILFPLKVRYSYSCDNKHYELLEEHKFKENKSGKVQFMSVKTQKPIEARYIKVFIHGTNICPDWHYGVGYPSWFFIDEVIIK